MADYTLQETKDAIVTLIEAIAPKAAVYAYWRLGEDHKKWPALMRSPRDNNRTHGYVVEFKASPEAEIRQGGGNRLWEFDIVGMHYHSTETDTSALFLAEVQALADAFDVVTGAEALPSAARLVMSYSYNHTCRPFGNEMCHLMAANLRLRPC